MKRCLTKNEKTVIKWFRDEANESINTSILLAGTVAKSLGLIETPSGNFNVLASEKKKELGLKLKEIDQVLSLPICE